MHELSLAEAIHKTIKELCQRSSWSRVRRITLKVGRLRQVNPELLSFAFDVLAQGAVAEGAELSVMELPVVFHCRACGRETTGDVTAFACVNCGSADVELLSGMELTIESMEVESQ